MIRDFLWQHVVTVSTQADVLVPVFIYTKVSIRMIDVNTVHCRFDIYHIIYGWMRYPSYIIYLQYIYISYHQSISWMDVSQPGVDVSQVLLRQRSSASTYLVLWQVSLAHVINGHMGMLGSNTSENHRKSIGLRNPSLTQYESNIGTVSNRIRSTE